MAYGIAPIRFESVSAVTATPTVEVGTMVEDGDEKYMYVYNTGNSQISPGYGATVSGVTGYSVTVSSVTAADFFVGVCKHATLTTGTYGWLLVRGFGPAQMGANDSCTTGAILTVGVDGTFALKSQSTGHQSPVVGKAVAGAASATSAYAFIRII
jgi:hypothetical protein